MPPFPNGGPVRLTIVSPLAGLDPTDLLDAGALAERIEAESRVEGLPPKTGVVVDGGGAWPLDGIAADLRLVAIGTRTAPALAIAIGAPVEWLGTTTPAAAPATVRTLLARFAVLLGRSPVRRLKELPAGLRSELVAGLDLASAVEPPRAPARVRARSPLVCGRRPSWPACPSAAAQRTSSRVSRG